MTKNSLRSIIILLVITTGSFLASASGNTKIKYNHLSNKKIGNFKQQNHPLIVENFLKRPKKSKKHRKSLYINKPLAVGNYLYVIKKIWFRKTVGNSFANQRADGVFMLVKLTIKNITSSPKSISSGYFKIIDNEGNSYEPSAEAMMLLTGLGYNTFAFKQLQPNIPSTGIVVFEVPTSRKKYYLQLSGGFFKGNITIPIN